MKLYLLYSIVIVLLGHTLYLSWKNFGMAELGGITSYKKTRGNESFEKVRFYATETNEPRVNVRANKVDIFAQEYAQYISPEGELYDNDGFEVKFKADRGNFSRNIEELTFIGNLNLDYKGMSLKCDRGNYSLPNDRFIGKGSVNSIARDEKTKDKIIVDSEKVLTYPKRKWSRFDGNVDGVIERKRKYEGNFYFKSDTIIADMEASRIDMKDNVEIKRKTMNLTSRNSSVFLENFNKELKYYELNDDVVIKQKIKGRASGRIIERVAYSEKLEGHVKDKKVILTGAPKVISEGDIIRGSKIVLRENASVIEVIDSTSRIQYKK